MKIEKEKKVSSLMIDIYCKRKHKSKKELCVQCKELKEYVFLRLDKCPFKEEKTFCSNCKIHCYQKDMRIKIKEVMRFAGPRMIFHHPMLAIKHIVESRREKKKNGKK